ncbi:DUF4345 domain-containing protein [Chitinophaga pendula]|uniref:DUF4345 domain-containing protein n=1 Tax=Chitinophaga TaxID=79328 RepID=UPI000BB01C38|nr:MULTISPECIES: DUF4345 domain-containing protein [Chitinophaga]ASZ13691.1 DUF4345 domain-containing protein [Chitinophaga sp. MD30]UCJ08693.1 DUF4345 domain-containing protein [Chitinophaga pendula]
MKIQTITKVFLSLTGIAFLNIAVQAILNPQSIMDLVSVQLDNISARNSIRAYYGGVNLAFAIFLLYGAFKMQREALTLVFLYCSGFVAGRLYSILTEGKPSAFILNWLVIESVLAILSFLLLLKAKRRLSPLA